MSLRGPKTPGLKVPLLDTTSGTVARVSGSQALRPRAVGALDPPTVLGLEGIRRRAKEIGALSWFEVLGVSEDAPPRAIQAAYEVLAELWSPACLPGELARARGDAEVIAAHIDNAYRMLTAELEASPPRRREGPSNAPTRILVPLHDTIRDLEIPTLPVLVVRDPGEERPVVDLARPTLPALARREEGDAHAQPTLPAPALRGGKGPDDTGR